MDKAHRGHTAFCTDVLLACGCYAPTQICIREENGVSEHGECGESGVVQWYMTLMDMKLTENMGLTEKSATTELFMY